MLLHNPRCSKSREAKRLLDEAGGVAVREYLKEPLSLDELRILQKRLGLPPKEWLRWGEDEAKGLDREAPPRELLEAMARNPRLMERPIFIQGDRAVVGRPPERVLELVDGTG